MIAKWEMTTVGELVRRGILERPMDGNHGSIHPRAEDFVASGVPFIMASDLVGGHIDTANCSFITLARAKALRKGFAKTGDVLLSHKATLGRTAIVGEIPGDFVMLTPQVTYYRSKDSSRLNNRFLKYYFDSDAFQRVLQSWSGGGSTRAYIGITDQLRLPVLLPPIEDQRIIASVLGSLDDKIELNRRMNETLEAIAQAFFKSWFVNFDPVSAHHADQSNQRRELCEVAVFPDTLQDSEAGKIPSGWEVKSVYDCATFINGVAFSKIHFSQDNSGLPIVKIAELKDGITAQTKFTNDQLSEKYRIRDGEILFSWSGSPDTSIDTFVWAGGDAWLNQHIFKVESGNGPEKLFVYHLLKHLKLTFIEIARDKQTTGLGHVTAQDLKRLKVAFPPVPVLEAFQRVVEPLFNRSFYTLTESRTLATLRDALLPKLMAGELPITSPIQTQGA